MIGSAANLGAWYDPAVTGWLYLTGGDWVGHIQATSAGGVPVARSPEQQQHYLSVQDAQIRAMYDRYAADRGSNVKLAAAAVGTAALVYAVGRALRRGRR